MSVRNEDGFWVDRNLDGELESSIGIESARLEACIAEAKRRRVEKVFGAPCFGFHGDDLDFLDSLPDVRTVWLWDVRLRSIEGLYSLTRLRMLGLPAERPGIDFTQLPTLEELTWNYQAHDRGLDSLERLTSLHMWHFNSRHRSYEGLRLPESIEYLDPNQRDLQRTPGEWVGRWESGPPESGRDTKERVTLGRMTTVASGVSSRVGFAPFCRLGAAA